MCALLMSCCPNPNPNFIEHAKNNSSIKTLIVTPHALFVRCACVSVRERVAKKPNRVVLDTESKVH